MGETGTKIAMTNRTQRVRNMMNLMGEEIEIHLIDLLNAIEDMKTGDMQLGNLYIKRFTKRQLMDRIEYVILIKQSLGMIGIMRIDIGGKNLRRDTIDPGWIVKIVEVVDTIETEMK